MTTDIEVQATTGSYLRKLLLSINGAFLVLMGGPFLLFDLLSYYWGVGPLGQLFYAMPSTMAFVEAHGLAFILGLLLLRAACREPAAHWHLVGMSIHLLLGACNLLFWSFIVAMDVVTLEVIVTSIHGLLALAQALAFAKAVGRSSVVKALASGASGED